MYLCTFCMCVHSSSRFVLVWQDCAVVCTMPSEYDLQTGRSILLVVKEKNGRTTRYNMLKDKPLFYLKRGNCLKRVWPTSRVQFLAQVLDYAPILGGDTVRGLGLCTNDVIWLSVPKDVRDSCRK